MRDGVVGRARLERERGSTTADPEMGELFTTQEVSRLVLVIFVGV
jgi:hypothetical protein